MSLDNQGQNNTHQSRVSRPAVICFWLIPLFIFLVISGIFALGLIRSDKSITSALIDKPLPAFSLPSLIDPLTIMTEDSVTGSISLLNAWASWCLPCKEEHPVLLSIAKRSDLPIYGFNYKDDRDTALAWLSELGNPFTAIYNDASGLVGIDLGISGVPETFILDENGIVRHKFSGILTEDVWQKEFLPVIQRLQGDDDNE